MSEEFDPYHVWLGIPPDEQPPNRYRLLGIRLFESNPGVIDNAADRQMAHLRTVQAGAHATLSQRLLNEVSAARVCLLNPEAKAAYDQRLRAAMPAAPPPPPASNSAIGPTPIPSASGSQIHKNAATGLPVAQVIPAAPSVAAPEAATDWDNLIGDPANGPNNTGRKSRPSTVVPRTSGNRLIYVCAGAGVLLAAAVGIAFFALGGPAEAVLKFNWPAADRAGVALAIDDQPVNIPATGPWEFRCPPGEHHIVAQRPAYKFESTIAVAAGDQPSIAADWRPKAVLVLSWPLAQRAGAKLAVDGHAQPVSQREPLEFPLEPGRHTVHATRPEAEPFETALTIANDQRSSVTVATPLWPALVLDLPIEQRQDATLTIDGKPAAIDAGAVELDFRLKPGQHTVHIARPGFQPFDQVADLSVGGSTPIAPIWQPVVTTLDPANGKPVVANDPTLPDKTASNTTPAEAAAPAKKLSPPSAADQERIAKELDDIYKVVHSPAKDRALVAELFKTADEPGSSPAERYMLLTKGIGLAAGLGDFETAFHGIDALDGGYEIDAFVEKQKLLDESVKTLTTADQVAGLAAAAIPLIDQAIAADQFDKALSIVATAKRGIAKRPSDFPRFKEADEQLAFRRREIGELQSSWNAVREAQTSVEKEPDNGAANLTLGHWYALTKNDWPEGLPSLAKGSDDGLKSLARQELAGNLDAKQQLQIADGWWDWAEKQKGVVRDSARLHAGALYHAALPSIDSALKKVVIEKRLVDLATIQQPGAPPTVTPGGSFPRGQWVDLLRLANPSADAIYGAWSHNGTELVCEPAAYSRIRFPIEVAGSYDLEVAFTRKEGKDDVNAIISVDGHPCMVMLSAFEGATSGLSRIDGVSVLDRPQFVVKPGKLENGHRYLLKVSVRILKDGAASVATFVDGKTYSPDWQGDPKSLGGFSGWELPGPRQIGLGVWNDRAVFHSVRLRILSGDATNAPAMTERPRTIVIASARWGSGSRMIDVTQIARASVRNGAWIWATLDFLKSDPAPGVRKHLIVTFEKAGKREESSIDEGNAWRMDENLAK